MSLSFHRRSMEVGVLSIVVWILGLIGCSGAVGDNKPVSSMPDDIIVRPASSGGVAASDAFADMWDYDKDAPFHTANVKGVLSIEESCVYVIDDYVWLFPGTPLEELPKPIRIFVNLPRSQTQYDPDTESIWVFDEGPMTSGDRVEMIGGGVGPNLPDACSTNTDRAFNVKSMTPLKCVPWLLPEHPSQSGCEPVPLDPFVGMWYYDDKEPFLLAAAEGLLLIEEPCIYIIDDFAWIFPVPEKLPDPVRIFVRLPREQTGYDSDTQSIWVHDEGPMTNGDRVIAAGGGVGQIPDVCSAGDPQVFTASHLAPNP